MTHLLQANQLIIQAKPSIAPDELVAIAYSAPGIYKMYRKFQPKEFRLKVVGKEEYLLDDVPLYRFKVNGLHASGVLYV